MAINKEEEYAKIEELVNSYKSGNNQSGLDIIECCKPFTNKFKNLICYGQLDLSNRSIRAFINMFVPNHFKIDIRLYRKSPSAMTLAESAAEFIRDQFYAFEPVEIDNIISIIILGLAKKYERKEDRNTFYAYLSSCFHYRLHDELIPMIRDMVHTCAMYGEEYDDNCLEASHTDTYNLNTIPSPINKLIVEESTDEVSDNWLLGHDADIFSCFTPFEKKILLLKYVKGLTDEEIGEQLGSCRLTIFRKRTKIVKALEEYAMMKGLLKG